MSRMLIWFQGAELPLPEAIRFRRAAMMAEKGGLWAKAVKASGVKPG